MLLLIMNAVLLVVLVIPLVLPERQLLTQALQVLIMNAVLPAKLVQQLVRAATPYLIQAAVMIQRPMNAVILVTSLRLVVRILVLPAQSIIPVLMLQQQNAALLVTIVPIVVLRAAHHIPVP